MGYLRSALERVSRGVSLQRRLPERFGSGPILVTPEAALKYWYRDLERVDPLLLSAVEELVGPEDVVWDIGANVGLFAFAAAGLSGPKGRVLAVEPDIQLVRLLQKSTMFASSPRAQVDVLCAAVSEFNAISALHVAVRGRASNSLGPGNSQTGGIRESHAVVTITLDWLSETYFRPDVIKIDVEGSEADVLAGGHAVLRKSRPKILCEVNEDNRPAVTRILTDCKYALFDNDKPKHQRKQLESAAWNTIAYPLECIR